MKKPPSYRLRPGYTQAITTLSDSLTKARRDYWLGEFGTAASREKYHRLLAAWEALGRRLPETSWDGDPPANRAPGARPAAGGAAHDDDAHIKVVEVLRAYWRWARTYYRPNEAAALRGALRLLRDHYGESAAEDFGPKRLRALRESMIRGDASLDPPRKPWTRGYVNQQTRRICRAFRWAASQELLPPAAHQALATVEMLKRGRTTAREGRTVAPVPQAMIDAVMPFLNRQVAALVRLQLLTGARSGELLRLRAIDIDTSGPAPGGVWSFSPKEHKTALQGKSRAIYFGPRAQLVLQPFMTNRPVDAFLFSPAEAEAERLAALHARRKTPLSCGNRPGSNRRERPARTPGPHYDNKTYYTAVQRACDAAFPPPERLRPATRADGTPETRAEFEARLTKEQKAELAAWRKANRWHPHRLRHAAASAFRRQFGLEAAQLMLGHASAALTDACYAERDQKQIAELAKRAG